MSEYSLEGSMLGEGPEWSLAGAPRGVRALRGQGRFLYHACSDLALHDYMNRPHAASTIKSTFTKVRLLFDTSRFHAPGYTLELIKAIDSLIIERSFYERVQLINTTAWRLSRWASIRTKIQSRSAWAIYIALSKKTPFCFLFWLVQCVKC